jgi:hypothetical protein
MAPSDDPTAIQILLIAELTSCLYAASIPHWLFGGWVVDFLAGEITRPHHDLQPRAVPPISCPFLTVRPFVPFVVFRLSIAPFRVFGKRAEPLGRLTQQIPDRNCEIAAPPLSRFRSSCRRLLPSTASPTVLRANRFRDFSRFRSSYRRVFPSVRPAHARTERLCMVSIPSLSGRLRCGKQGGSRLSREEVHPWRLKLAPIIRSRRRLAAGCSAGAGSSPG